MSGNVTIGNVTYTEAYLAESKTSLLWVMLPLPIPLEIISTGIRLWARMRGQGGGLRLSNLHWDDYLMVVATIIGSAACFMGVFVGPSVGLGRHIQVVSDADKLIFLRGAYIFSHLYNMGIAFTKLSVLALYYRIFSTRRFRMMVIATACLIGAWVVVMEFTLGFSCIPVEASWGAKPGKCINLLPFYYFTNVTNMLFDIWILIMPLPIILRLQTTKDKRMSLVFLFSVGLGTVVISAVRLSYIFGVSSPDYTWSEADLGILSNWEPCGGILCANLPLIYRTMIRVVSKVRAKTNSGNSRSAGPSKAGEASRPGNKSSNGNWTRLNHSKNLDKGDNTGLEVGQHQVMVSAVKCPSVSTDTESLKPNGIVVQHDITQDSQHNFELDDLDLPQQHPED